MPSTIATSITWPLPDARASRMPHTDAERHEHAAAAEVADEVDRRRGLAAVAAEVRERAGERDVVDVVARGLRHRAVLAPAGHAPVHELRVAREAHVGTEAEPLGHAGPEALEQRVGLLDEPQHELDAFGVLQVDADRAAPAVQRLEVRLVERRRVHLLRAVDRARCRRPCRRATCPRTAPARCRPARRSSLPKAVPCTASTLRRGGHLPCTLERVVTSEVRLDPPRDAGARERGGVGVGARR